MKKLTLSILCSLIIWCVSPVISAQNTSNLNPQATTAQTATPMQLAGWWGYRESSWCDRHPHRCYRAVSWCDQNPRACYKRWCRNHPGECRARWCERHPRQCGW